MCQSGPGEAGGGGQERVTMEEKHEFVVVVYYNALPIDYSRSTLYLV